MATVECLCPPKAGEVRHPDGDTVTLRERLDFRGVLTARNAIALLKGEDPDVSSAEILATLTESYLLLGVASWTLQTDNDKGKPVPIPVNNAAIREYLFTHEDAAITVADEADELYRERIIAPLVLAAQNSLPPTPTKGSTSATNGSGSKAPKPPKPSSTSTTRTDGIETIPMSPVGVSSSSQSSA